MHKATKTFILAVSCACALSACGGGNPSSQAPSLDTQSKHIGRSQKQTAADYQTVVQELYISYFGRPADPTGLANFEQALEAAGAPSDIQGLTVAYATNPAVQSLVNAFGTSNESQSLYGSGNATAFVTAVFQNVLGRQPQQAGLTYWTDQITSGALSQGDAALAIMAGGLANTTPQGLLDAKLIKNRLIVAQSFTKSVTAQNAVSAYSGANAAGIVRGMLGQVTASTNVAAFQSQVAATIENLLASTATTFTVGGAVTNLTASGLVLSDGIDKGSVAANSTSFMFPTALSKGTNYNVVVTQEPTGLFCTVSNGVGSIGSSNISNVTISCAPVTQSGLTCPAGNGAGTKGVSFYDPSNYFIFNINTTAANAYETTTLAWGAQNNGIYESYTGSLAAVLWAVPTSYSGGTIHGHVMGTFLPDFTGSGAYSPSQLIGSGYSTTDVISNSSYYNPQAGQYCMVATLMEYSPTCGSGAIGNLPAGYCIVDWLQFPGATTFP